jgi:hypothetical protein
MGAPEWPPTLVQELLPSSREALDAMTTAEGRKR